ncbi:MAG: hypothetical protein AAFQ84_06760 [Pseudomonadota bacterium]
MSFRNVIIASAVALGMAASAAAELGTVEGFKKSTVRAKTDAASVMLRASEMDFPLTIVAEKPERQQIAFSTDEGQVWVRLADVETVGYGATQEIKCVTTRVAEAEGDSQLGATQMGAGISRCAQ